MPTRNTIFNQTVRKDGYFNYSELYSFCFDWLEREGYIPVENVYQERGSGSAKDIILDWQPFKKITDYFMFEIRVEWFIQGMVSAEIERDGKKERVNKGDVKIKIRGNLIKDYEKRWEEKPLYKFMRGVYEQYIVRTTVDQYEKKLANDCVKFTQDVKAFLELM